MSSMRFARYLPNRNVFRERLKRSIEVACRKCSGSEFQVWGLAYDVQVPVLHHSISTAKHVIGEHFIIV